MTVLFVRWIVAGLLLMVGAWSVVYNIVILLIRLTKGSLIHSSQSWGDLLCAVHGPLPR